MVKSEIWLRFVNKEDYLKRSEPALKFLGDNEGGAEVVIFLDETKEVMNLPSDKRCDADAYSRLVDLLGEDNVKIKTKVKELQRNFCTTDNEAVSLERIADALEAINSNLADISATLDNIDQNLDDCIARNGNNKFLCITGNIANY